MRRPTRLVGLALTLLIPQARAQVTGADSSGTPAPGFRGSFHAAPVVAPLNPALAPGGRLGPRTAPALVAAAWERRLRAALPETRGFAAAVAEGALAAVTLAAAPGPPGAGEAPPPPPTGQPTFQAAGRGGLLGPYADIGMQLNVRFELKADQFRNLRCTTFERQQAISGCTAAFPTITPNPQYAIRTAGVVGRRLHVNVDFDSQREFDANNSLQVWYEGLEDEVLRRVEAGNVSFQTAGSRFISAAIPANNFGVQAIGQLGALELRGIYAQQKGNVVRDRVYTIGATTSQPLDHEARDLDYEAGRFFFVVDPAAIPGFPAVDVLNIDPAALPDSLRVGGLQVYRVRAIAPGSTGNQNLGGVRAVACGVGATRALDCAGERAGPFQWEILQAGKDYYVDPSGAWVALASRLDQSDYLAVSYIPAGQEGCLSGPRPCVGTFPVSANPDTAVIDTLRLVYDPRPGVTAASPAFRFEIRSAYRLGGADLSRESVALALLVNQRERTVASGQTYLDRLGLAVTSDPNKFDQYNRLFPRERDPQRGAPVQGYYVIFPHLQPFADSTKLTAAERNDSLYRTPRVLLAAQGPPSVFALREHADLSASGDRSTLSLNSFQVRDGSEKIYVGPTLLTRGTDYSIDYATGQVQFRNPDSLFQSGVAQVRAQFEERSSFAVAPTSIYGLAAKYDLGTLGAVNFTGLFQRQQSAFTRPPLGLEPSASFIGGISTELHFQPQWLTQAVDALPLAHTTAPSFLNVNAEVAVSKPSPNQVGQAYLEEFEVDAGRLISLNENAWHWGSIPTSGRGAEPFGITTGFDPVEAAFLTWQSLPIHADGSPVQFLPTQIDPTIRLTGQAQSAEPVLWLMLKPDTVLGLANANTGAPNWVRPRIPGAPRWRSITQTLSATGVDLSRVEYLEFWVWEDGRRGAKASNTAVLLDFGSVFEDALAFVPDSFTVAGADTTYYGQRPAGLGREDTERDPVTRSWNAAVNDEGILSDRVTDGIRDATTGQLIDTLPLCSASKGGQIQTFFFGDLRSRCGRHNGAVDTEDQDGDFLLDSATAVKTAENYVRFVFPIGDDRFFVRDGGMVADPAGGSAGWRLYRIPFRTDTLMQGQPNLRQVQTLRLTVVVPGTSPDSQVFFALSRVRLVGASWLKRADTPIRGIAGDRGIGTGEVVASVASTENRDLGYTPPPGVFDQASRRDAGFQLGTTQINERSLRLLARGLEPGQHAEAFNRFSGEGDKNLLKYRRLRAWARGRGPGWEDGDLEFYLKVGKDENNFYFYHAPARTASWEPEVVVDFDRWLALRARVEQAWLRGDTARVYAGCPDTTVVPFDSAYVMCDGPYIVHVRDPGTAPPNLAAVQELAVGILRVGNRVFVDQAELWVDDIRLSDVVDDAGAAGALDVTLTAANLADLAFSVSRRDANFRQLGEDPSYVTDDALSLGGTVRLERFLPDRWGVAAPLTVRYSASGSSPFYLDRTDLRADALPGLRTPRAAAASYGLALRRVRPSRGALGRWLLDPLAVTGNYSNGDTRSSLSRADANSYGVSLDYNLLPRPVTVLAAPGFLRALVGKLPRFLRDSRFFQDFATSRLRLNPATIQFHSGLFGSSATRSTFQVPVATDYDRFVVPSRSLTRGWSNSATLGLQPFQSLLFRASLSSQRDLRDYGDSTTTAALVRRERRTLFGQDVGLETQRTLGTSLTLTPPLADWLRPRLNWTTSFALGRDPNAGRPVRDVGDTAGAFHLPAAFSNSQRLDLGARVDPRLLSRGLAGDSARLTRWLGRITPIDFSYSRARRSTFDRAPDGPGVGYQLGMIGLDGFQQQGGLLAGSAAETEDVRASTGATLVLGLRGNATYSHSRSVTWVRRADQQVPLTSSSVEWPSGNVSWAFTPPSRSIGRVLASLTAQLGYRQRVSASQQASVGGSAIGTSFTSTTERGLTPSVTLAWAYGIFSSVSGSHLFVDQRTAGNLFHTLRDQRNATLAFSFRPPRSLLPLRTGIRTNVNYSEITSTACLRTAGQDRCVPYADTRQSQTQITMDTDFPPSLSAGFQMAYLVNEERQLNRKTAQLVITAFVQLSTSVGQLR
jgi:motility/secretion related protein SprA